MSFSKLLGAAAVATVASATSAFAHCNCYQTDATFRTKGAALFERQNKSMSEARRECPKGAREAVMATPANFNKVSNREVSANRRDPAKAAAGNGMFTYVECKTVGSSVEKQRFKVPMMGPGD